MITPVVCFVIFLVHTAVVRIILYRKKLCSKTTFTMLINGLGCGFLTLFFSFVLTQFVTLGEMSRAGAVLCFFAIGSAYCCSVTNNKEAMGNVVGSFILAMALCTYLFSAFGRY